MVSLNIRPSLPFKPSIMPLDFPLHIKTRISERVMSLLEALAIHSMDEAFLGLTGVSHCRKMGHRLGPVFWPVKCARQAGIKV